MSGATSLQGLNSKVGLFVIFLVLGSVGLALSVFVNRNTTNISDALAAEVLEQQSDVAVLLHEYDRLIIALETDRLSNGQNASEPVTDALARAENQLMQMRFNYSFERLDGAATAHAYVKPAIDDVRQWLSTGIPGLAPDRQRIIAIASERILARHDRLRDISSDSDEVARELITTQKSYLTEFGNSLTILVGAFAMLAAGIALLLTRQRDLQFQIAEGQRQHTQRIRDFADSGADWFWEMNSALQLRWWSGRSLSGPSVLHENTSDGSVPPYSHEIDDRQWPVRILYERVGFHEYETEWVTRDNSVKTVSISGTPLFDNDGKFAGYRGVGRDITGRKQMEHKLELANRALIEAETRGREQAETALRDSEIFLRTSLNALPQNLAILNDNGYILEANTAWRDYAKKGDNGEVVPQAGGIGWHIDEIFSRKSAAERIALQEVRALIDKVTQGSSDNVQTEVRFFNDPGVEWLAVALSSFQSNGIRYCVLAMEEVTDRKQLEEQDRQLRAELAHFSRLTTVGELATGLAHELTQPLSAISYNCDALLSGVQVNAPLDSSDIEAINAIHSEADRAGAIIKGLRKMVRKETGSTTATDINELVTETIRLGMADANRHQIKVRLNLASNLPHPEIDAVQIQQVLVNLERNGVEAIRHSQPTRREMVISTARMENGFVRVTVQDSGGGLAQPVKDALFSPFLTTKKDGMGMGLSISRSIVESHGGQLWVDFDDQSMTTFHFTLPDVSGDRRPESQL